MKKTRNLLIILLLSALVILGLTSQVRAEEREVQIENAEALKAVFGERNVEVKDNNVKLLENVVIDTDETRNLNFVNGVELTIDLNGKTLSAESKTGDSVDCCACAIDSGAKITINDSSSNKTGKVNELYFGVLHENSKLIVNGGNFELTNYINEMFYVSSGELIINNGKFTSECGIRILDNGNVTINDCTFNTCEGVVYLSNGNLTINKGTFTVYEMNNGKKNKVNMEYPVIRINSGNVTINGGNYEGPVGLSIGKVLKTSGLGDKKNRDINVVINDGNFIGYSSTALSVLTENSEELNGPLYENLKFIINNGTFTGRLAGLVATATEGLRIKGGKYAATGLGSMNYGAICVMAETEEEANSILVDGYKLKDGFTLKEIEGVEVWCTEKEETVKPEKYNVKLETATNGRLGVDKTLVAPGEKVAVVAEPNEGYEVDTITVKTAAGVVVEVSENSFVMPEEDVVVSATFKTVEEPDTPEEKEEKDDTPKTGCPNLFVALLNTVAVLFK